jgi:hypothetical protein
MVDDLLSASSAKRAGVSALPPPDLIGVVDPLFRGA